MSTNPVKKKRSPDFVGVALRLMNMEKTDDDPGVPGQHDPQRNSGM
jgi:hypothetical protein